MPEISNEGMSGHRLSQPRSLICVDKIREAFIEIDVLLPSSSLAPLHLLVKDSFGS